MFVLSYASFGGRTSLESPTMHLVVGGLFRIGAWCRGVSSNRKRSGVLAGQATSKAERVNAVHVSSFQENRKFSSTKAKYGNCVTCHHVAHSLSLFLYGLFPVPLEDAILRVCHAFFSAREIARGIRGTFRSEYVPLSHPVREGGLELSRTEKEDVA